jgi:hypothetical protein
MAKKSCWYGVGKDSTQRVLSYASEQEDPNLYDKLGNIIPQVDLSPQDVETETRSSNCRSIWQSGR